MLTLSQNARKKALSVSALSLCCPANEVVARPRSEFVDEGSGEGSERGFVEKGCETGLSALGPYLSYEEYV
jgi:hypothetical protein